MNIAYTERYAAYRAEEESVFSHPSGRREEWLVPLEDGYAVRTRYFWEEKAGYCLHASESVLLDGEGRTVYTWRNLNDDAEFAALVRHRDGRRYLVFRRELYGYSVLEIETGEDFHFVPSQSLPAEGEKFEETFIWTGVHYDPVSSLLAASGCYWACPNSMVFLDFSDPLSEQDCGCWVEMHEVVDPDYDLYDDIEMENWNVRGWTRFRCTSATGNIGWQELLVPQEKIVDAVREKKLRSKERG